MTKRRRFVVYEVQEVTRTEVFTHEVEADSEAEAIERASEGGAANVEPCGTIGDPDYGRSGFGLDVNQAVDEFERAL